MFNKTPHYNYRYKRQLKRILLFILVVISLNFSIHVRVGLLVVLFLLAQRLHELAGPLGGLSHASVVLDDELSLLLYLLLADLLLRQQDLRSTSAPETTSSGEGYSPAQLRPHSCRREISSASLSFTFEMLFRPRKQRGLPFMRHMHSYPSFRADV